MCIHLVEKDMFSQIFFLTHEVTSPFFFSFLFKKNNIYLTDFCFSRPGLFANPELFDKDYNWSFLHNISSNGYEDNFGNL